MYYKKDLYKAFNFFYQEALQVAERRLLRDSRTHSLTLSNAGRFSSSHVFLLFNDCFVHVQVDDRFKRTDEL